MERNFPDLDFTIIHLSTNRRFYGKHSRILPFVIHTPVEYTMTLTKELPLYQIFTYREAIYDWLGKLLSLRNIKNDGKYKETTTKDTNHGTEITTDCQ